MKSYSIGIDIGGTKILIALVNKETGEVICANKKKTSKGNKKILSKLIDGISELCAENSIDLRTVSSIGIGSSGLIDRENGIIISAPNLESYDFELADELKKVFNLPVFVGNDVEAGTLGEMKFGAGRNCDDFMCIFIGTGIGSAIVKDGKLIKGASGTAGEFGHIVIAYNGRHCGCGAYGCLETYASRKAVEGKIWDALNKGTKSAITDYIKPDKPISSSMIAKSIEKNDVLVTSCILEASEYLSCGIASVINLLNPKCIILGGGLIDAVNLFYEETVLRSKQKALKLASDSTIFKKAELGDYSGVIGAACLENVLTDNKVIESV